MKKYVVDGNLDHDQRVYKTGDLVELEDAQANPLLELGRVKPAVEKVEKAEKPAKAAEAPKAQPAEPAKPETKPEKAAEAKLEEPVEKPVKAEEAKPAHSVTGTATPVSHSVETKTDEQPKAKEGEAEKPAK